VCSLDADRRTAAAQQAPRRRPLSTPTRHAPREEADDTVFTSRSGTLNYATRARSRSRRDAPPPPPRHPPLPVSICRNVRHRLGARRHRRVRRLQHERAEHPRRLRTTSTSIPTTPSSPRSPPSRRVRRLGLPLPGQVGYMRNIFREGARTAIASGARSASTSRSRIASRTAARPRDVRHAGHAACMVLPNIRGPVLVRLSWLRQPHERAVAVPHRARGAVRRRHGDNVRLNSISEFRVTIDGTCRPRCASRCSSTNVPVPGRDSTARDGAVAALHAALKRSARSAGEERHHRATFSRCRSARRARVLVHPLRPSRPAPRRARRAGGTRGSRPRELRDLARDLRHLVHDDARGKMRVTCPRAPQARVRSASRASELARTLVADEARAA